MKTKSASRKPVRKKKKKSTLPKRVLEKTVQSVKKPPSDERSFAVFSVGRERFCFDLDLVLETLYTFNIIEVSHLPEPFVGVIKLKGATVPVVDLQKLLKEEEVETEMKTCLIVSTGTSNTGFITDSDIEIVPAEKGRVHPLPDCYTAEEAKFLEGIFWLEDNFIGILKAKEMIDSLSGLEEK